MLSSLGEGVNRALQFTLTKLTKLIENDGLSRNEDLQSENFREKDLLILRIVRFATSPATAIT